MFLAIVASLTIQAATALTGDEVLLRAEQAMNAPKDRVATEQMQLAKGNGQTRDRMIEIFQKGSDKRLLVFQSPADVKGVGFLSLSARRMYLYLPAFHKVRRIASSGTKENFAGTDFSYEDLSDTRFSENYTAVLQAQDEGKFRIALTPKPGAEVNYAQEIMWVDKQTFIPIRTEYYDADGSLVKVLTMREIEKIDGYWFPRRMTMKSIRDDHTTTLEMIRIRHDTGLEDRFFTERNLKRQAR